LSGLRPFAGHSFCKVIPARRVIELVRRVIKPVEIYAHRDRVKIFFVYKPYYINEAASTERAASFF
jgi:hypothetical protein